MQQKDRWSLLITFQKDVQIDVIDVDFHLCRFAGASTDAVQD